MSDSPGAFKRPHIRQQFRESPPMAALLLFLTTVNRWWSWWYGSEIIITGYLERRPGKSFHAIRRAVDIRCKPLSPSARDTLVALCRMAADLINKLGAQNGLLQPGELLQVIEHIEMRGKPQWHIHIEQDNGQPAPPNAEPDSIENIL